MGVDWTQYQCVHNTCKNVHWVYRKQKVKQLGPIIPSLYYLKNTSVESIVLSVWSQLTNQYDTYAHRYYAVRVLKTRTQICRNPEERQWCSMQVFTYDCESTMCTAHKGCVMK